MKMTMAATRAPTSGRASRRLDRPRVTRFEDSAGADGGGGFGGVAHGLLRWLIREGWPARSRRPPLREVRTSGCSSCTKGRICVDVGLVDERRTGQHGAAAAHDVAVLLEQVELGDGQVALEVGLLVDAELELAVLHCLGRVDVQVEGADLGLAVRRLDGLDGVQRLGGAEGDDPVDVLVLAELGLDGGGDRGVVCAVDLDVLGVREGVLDALAAVLQGDRPGLLDRAQDLRGSGGLGLLPGLLACQELVGREVREGAGLLEEVGAGVEAVDGDAGGDCLLDVRDERVRRDQGGRDPVDVASRSRSG